MFSIYNDDLWLKISFRQVEFCETMAQGTTNLVLAAEENLFGFMPYDFITTFLNNNGTPYLVKECVV